MDVESPELNETADPIAIVAEIPPPPVQLCPCHANETKPGELQIEMNLLCKCCNFLFRRPDCFHTHFRTSAICRERRLNKETLNEPKLFCTSCRCFVVSFPELRSHLEMHTRRDVGGTVVFICNICKVVFLGIGMIFYSHWMQHQRNPNFSASQLSFPKLSVVPASEVLKFSNNTSKSEDGFIYIAEHVCQNCRYVFLFIIFYYCFDFFKCWL